MTKHSRTEKLQKALARAGLGSRREMERWIQAQRVTVNNRKARLGARIGANDSVLVDDRPVSIPQPGSRISRILLYNKPAGEICSRCAQDSDCRTVFESLPPLTDGRWLSVGRLDVNSQGLLMFTNNGELAHRMTHPGTGIDREYAVRVLGKVTPAMLQRLQQGVELDDGPGKFTDIRFAGGTGANRWYHVALLEGRHREVRRLWESQRVRVSRLKRVRFGPVILPSTLRQGQWLEMQPHEVAALLNLVQIRTPMLRDKSRILIPYPGMNRVKPHPRG